MSIMIWDELGKTDCHTVIQGEACVTLVVSYWQTPLVVVSGRAVKKQGRGSMYSDIPQTCIKSLAVGYCLQEMH